MMRILTAALFLLTATASHASSESTPLKQIPWRFEGALGTFDRQSIQRGFQVYKEVCSACHSLNHIAYRNLAEIGFSEAEIKAIAAEKNVMDGPNDEGEMFERPGRPSDYFAPPFANEKAARTANNGTYPPDLSLMTKARVDGPNYIYSLLTSYGEAPADVAMNEGMQYNPYFPGGQIAMATPLAEGAVQYSDGTVASVDQMAQDVVNFLQWAAEPEMEQRKHMGIKVILYLAVFTVLFWFAKKRIWKQLKK